MSEKPVPKRRRRCPVCGKPLEPSQRFCSERCQRVDLGRWLAGDYAIAADEAPSDPEETG